MALARVLSEQQWAWSPTDLWGLEVERGQVELGPGLPKNTTVVYEAKGANVKGTVGGKKKNTSTAVYDKQ